jgi:uncharacterized RDD family membrane protein YckC
MSNLYAPPKAVVRDVSVRAAIVPADRGTRLGAAILDGFIFGVMVYAPFFVGAAIGSTASTGPVVGMVIALAGLAVWSWLTLRYVMRDGQSIAKKMVGIKVVRSDGSPISLGRLFWLRNFLNTVISIVPLYGVIDSLFILAESRQCLHDKIADTIVIKA